MTFTKVQSAGFSTTVVEAQKKLLTMKATTDICKIPG